MNTGVLSHKLRYCTHLGEVIALYLCFIPEYTCISLTPLSPFQQLEGPSTPDGTYFHWSQYQVFRVRQSFHTISTNISKCFTNFCCCLYLVWRFSAAVCLNIYITLLCLNYFNGLRPYSPSGLVTGINVLFLYYIFFQELDSAHSSCYNQPNLVLTISILV